MADPTKRYEAIEKGAEEEYKRISGDVEDVAPTHPVGVAATTREDMLAEFRAVELDPNGLTLKRMELDRAYGPVEGAKQFVQWYTDLMNG
ncbi:MAG: hypothetical protein V3W37_08755 [Candidatus Binatia bacterium]